NAGGTEEKSAAKKGKKAAEARRPSEEVKPEGPWLASRPFFAKRFQEPIQPDETRECLDNPKSLPCSDQVKALFGIDKGQQGHIEFVIATVSDPLHTRLALLTDDAVQAIQFAARQTGWVFARQWIPWTDTVDPEEGDPEARRKQRALIRE